MPVSVTGPRIVAAIASAAHNSSRVPGGIWQRGVMTRRDYFDEPVAARYDAELEEMGEAAAVDPVVDVLARLAGATGSALEFAIGTGRIGLPLAARGVTVAGIEFSAAMVDQLRAKPGAESVEVVIGDMAVTTVGATFDVVFLVFNTIMNLTSQEDQVATFANAARHLRPHGCFVVEVMQPQLERLSAGETIVPFAVGDDRLGFDEYDVPNQGLVSHHYVRVGELFEHRPVPFRYVWPAEMDLMAQLAGLRLRERWGGWRGEAFTSTSAQTVSVWEKVA